MSLQEECNVSICTETKWDQHIRGIKKMKHDTEDRIENKKTSGRASTVMMVVSWLVETDREYRTAQSIINERYNKHL